MKKSDITQPVIDKCKQIAEYWRMEIYEGCWYVDIDLVRLWQLKEIPSFPSEVFSIPSISDCLEKLREGRWIAFHVYWGIFAKKFVVEIQHYPPTGTTSMIIKKHQHTSESLHEALLSALLEVLKEAK
jgi:hypothetical protein